MKKFFKILGITLLVLLALFVITPFVLKPKVVKMIKQEANAATLANINFDEDIGISLLSSFPKLGINVKNLSVIGIGEFEGDTLLYTKELSVGLDVMNIINDDRANIKYVELEKPVVNLIVNRDNKANWDIFPSDSVAGSDSTALSFGLEEIEIKDGRFSYSDAVLVYETSANHIDASFTGDLEADNFELDGTLNSSSLGMSYHHLPIVSDVNTAVDIAMAVDMKNMAFEFKKGELLLNDLEIDAKGDIKLNEDDINFNLDFASPSNDFKSILSVVPAIYQKDFIQVKTSGSMAFSGFLKGKMTDDRYPAFHFKTNVKNGFFKYPTVKEAVSNINLDLAVDNKDGVLNHTIINLKQFKATVLNEVISAKAIVKTPITDPYLDTEIEGKLDLGRVKDFYPLDDNESYTGKVETELKVKSFVSYFETEKYDKVKASGYLNAVNVQVKNSDLQDPLEITSLKTVLKPKEISINEFSGALGKSDFDVKGKIENTISYLIKDSTLRGNISFKSNYFNLNPFMTEEEVEQIESPNPQDTAPLVYIDVPGNLGLNLEAEVNTLIYDNLKVENVSGAMKIANKIVEMKNVKGDLFGGAFAMNNGSYDATKPETPFSALDFNINKVDITKTVSYFDFLGKLSPILNFANGLFSLDFNMGTQLLTDLSPKYKTFNGEGVATISSAKIKGLDALNKIGEILKIPLLKDFNVKDLKIRFKIINGDFALLDSLKLPLYKGIVAKLAGSSSLEGKLKYFARLDIPRELFGEANTALNGLLDKTKAKGLNIDISNMVPVDVAIGGDFGKPNLLVNLAETKRSLIDNVKEQAKKEVVRKIDEGKEMGKAKITEEKEKARQRITDSIAKVRRAAIERADRVVEEAAARASAIKAEARIVASANKVKVYAQADSIESKGGNPLEKLATKKAAEKLKKEADKKEAQFIAEADKRADAILNKAKEQRAKLD